jgi:predicted DCC family thiol-disulfide oxidoreductase YuxK
MIEKTPIIVFDGVCGLCNRAVAFIIKRDPQKKFRFIAAQSPHLSLYVNDDNCLKKINSNESVVLTTDGNCHFQSDAVFLILKELNTPLRKLYFLHFIPKFIRDGVYVFISKRRYRWFGRYEQCAVPNSTLSDRFL